MSHKSFYLPAPNQNKIYVIGGDYEMSCEVYDIKENKWSFISSYNTLLGNSLYSFSSAMAVSSSSQPGNFALLSGVTGGAAQAAGGSVE